MPTNKFNTKLRKARASWVKEYQHSIELTLKNAKLLENLRRTVRPLKLYREYLNHIGISERTAQRIVALGDRDKNGVLTKNSNKLPSSYATLEIVLRLSDAKINEYCRSAKIKSSSTRKQIQILVGGYNPKKDDVLKPKFRNTNKFSDIRIDKGYADEDKLMRLLKDLKKLKEKYPFIHTDDKGFVDRVKKIRREEDKKAELFARASKSIKTNSSASDFIKSRNKRKSINTKGWKI